LILESDTSYYDADTLKLTVLLFNTLFNDNTGPVDAARAFTGLENVNRLLENDNAPVEIIN